MVPYVLLGIALLVLLYGLGRWFASANPSSLAKWVKWGLIGIGTVGTIFLGVTGRMNLAFIPLAIAVLPWLMSRMAARGNPNPTPGSQSDVETPYLRMSLDHDSGAMNGVVLQGRYEGRNLDELSEPQLLDLFQECSARDEQGARLLETYLDRTLGEGWRERAGEGERAEQADEPPRGERQKGWGRRRSTSSRPPMTREEAFEILGLEPGASKDEIKEAHRTLMLKIHPDQGGSNYLAAKINQAKDLLLGS